MADGFDEAVQKQREERQKEFDLNMSIATLYNTRTKRLFESLSRSKRLTREQKAEIKAKVFENLSGYDTRG